MNKFSPLPLSIACLLSACNMSAPQNYFDRAVLNCNIMHGFAKEIIDDKIQSLETNLAKIKQLQETDDSREMLRASLALYNYVLPVYKTEYQELAKLYDEGATREQIEVMEQSISAKYSAGFAALFDKLTAVAKPYAARHDIKVKWDVSTSPSL